MADNVITLPVRASGLSGWSDAKLKDRLTRLCLLPTIQAGPQQAEIDALDAELTWRKTHKRAA